MVSMTTLPFILEHIKIKYVAVAPVTGPTSGKIKNICTKCILAILTGTEQLLGGFEFLLSSRRGMFNVLFTFSKDVESYFIFVQRVISVLRQGQFQVTPTEHGQASRYRCHLEFFNTQTYYI